VITNYWSLPPASIKWALLGNSQWGERILSFLGRANIGKMGPDKVGDKIRKITGYEGWCNLVEDPELDDDEAVCRGRNNEAIWTIIVRPPLRVA
jgi:hypothetical protein